MTTVFFPFRPNSTYQSCNRTGRPAGPVRSGPAEDSLPAGIPAGRTNFFFTGPVWIFFEFFPIFFRKNNQKGVFFENQKLFTNVEDYFGKKNCIKLSYWVKICHGCFYIYPIHVGTTFCPYSSTNDILSFKTVFIGQNYRLSYLNVVSEKKMAGYWPS